MPRLNSAEKTQIPRLGAKFRGPRKTVNPTYKLSSLWLVTNWHSSKVFSSYYHWLDRITAEHWWKLYFHLGKAGLICDCLKNETRFQNLTLDSRSSECAVNIYCTYVISAPVRAFY